MFREMRRKAQQISTEECMEILLNAKTGVLGLHGEDGYPYTVPVNFVFTPPGTGNGPASDRDESADVDNESADVDNESTDSNNGSADTGNGSGPGEKENGPAPAGTGNAPLGTIGFHCAKTGHKIDAIRADNRVSFTVIDRDEVMPKDRTTKYRSVIVFGRAEFVEGDENLRRAANAVGAKYSSGYEDLYMAETEDTIRRKTLCCVEITIDHMTGKIGKELMLERKRHEND